MANSVLSLLIQSLYRGGGTKEARADMKQLEQGLGSVIQQATGFNMSMGSLSSLAGVAGVALAGMHAEAKLFKEWSAYTLEVGDLADKLGTTAEEASALKEMAADLNVPLGSLEMAFKRMATQGMQPSIEGLTQVRAKLNEAKTPSERLALAQQMLGRAGADLLPIFEQLTDEQLRGYIDGMREGQVVTGQEVEMARRQREALDSVSDSWENVKLSIGGFIAMKADEPLRRINEVLSGQKTYWQALLETLGLVKPEIEEVGDTIRRLKDDLLETPTELDIDVDADVSPAEEELKRIAEKTPGTPEYWAALRLQVEAKAEDAITASRLAFLEWLRYHPQMELTIIERVELATPQGGGTRRVGGAQMAGGGLFSAAIASVGEQGEEGLVRTPLGVVVIPHEQWKRLKNYLGPLEAFGTGGAIDVAVYGSWPTKGRFDPGFKSGETLEQILATTPTVDLGHSSMMKSLGGGPGGIGVASAAASAAAVAAVAEEAAASASAGVAGAVPMAVAQQMSTQNEIIARGQGSIVSAIQELRDVIVRAVREGVQMGQGWSG